MLMSARSSARKSAAPETRIGERVQEGGGRRFKSDRAHFLEAGAAESMAEGLRDIRRRERKSGGEDFRSRILERRLRFLLEIARPTVTVPRSAVPAVK